MKAAFYFRSGRRQHPLLRVLFAILALVLLGLASVFVMLIAAGVLGAWLLRRGWQRLRGSAPKGAASGGEVIDAEYRVIVAERARLVSR